MKKYMMIALVSVMALGCARDAQVKSPAEETKVNQNVGDNKSDHDGFDSFGQVCADGSRWAWNESKKAYEYLSSEEMKQKYHDAWEATKKAASSAYDSATSDENKAKAQEMLDSAKAKAQETYNSVSDSKSDSKK